MLKTITNAGSERAVLPEPALKGRYFAIVFGFVMLVIGITSYVLLDAFVPLQLSRPVLSFSIWLSESSLFIIVLFTARVLRWTKLDKKRQLAAMQNLSSRSQPYAFYQPDSSAPLPNLSLRLQRSRSALYISSTVLGLVFLLFSVLEYGVWQKMAQVIVQQGFSPDWLLLVAIEYSTWCCLLSCVFFGIVMGAPCHQLIATSDGLVCSLGRRFASIPWHEARLFAVIAYPGTPVFELSSRTAVIRWSEKPSRGYSIPPGVMGVGIGIAHPSKEVYSQHIQTLNAIVAARTGLPMQDLR